MSGAMDIHFYESSSGQSNSMKRLLLQKKNDHVSPMSVGDVGSSTNHQANYAEARHSRTMQRMRFPTPEWRWSPSVALGIIERWRNRVSELSTTWCCTAELPIFLLLESDRSDFSAPFQWPPLNYGAMHLNRNTKAAKNACPPQSPPPPPQPTRRPAHSLCRSSRRSIDFTKYQAPSGEQREHHVGQ